MFSLSQLISHGRWQTELCMVQTSVTYRPGARTAGKFPLSRELGTYYDVGSRQRDSHSTLFVASLREKNGGDGGSGCPDFSDYFVSDFLFVVFSVFPSCR